MAIVSPDFSGLKPRIERIQSEAKKMLTISTCPDTEKQLVEVNNSSLSLLLACGRKSNYILKRKLHADSASPALVFGSAIHAALEVFYSVPHEHRSIPENFFAHWEDIAFGQLSPNDPSLGDHFIYKALAKFIEANASLAVLADADKHSTSTGVWLLKEYFETYINDQYVVYVDEKGPFTERTVEHVVYEDDKLIIKLFGTIDVVLKDLHTKQILPADHKTSSQLGTDFFNRLKPNHQYTGYLLLCREALGLDTNFFLVNALQKKTRPKTARGLPPHFARQITSRDEQDFSEFKNTLIWAVKNYLTWDESDFWPMGQVNECAAWGGCQFLDVCAAPTELRENMLKAKFQEG